MSDSTSAPPSAPPSDREPQSDPRDADFNETGVLLGLNRAGQRARDNALRAGRGHTDQLQAAMLETMVAEGQTGVGEELFDPNDDALFDATLDSSPGGSPSSTPDVALRLPSSGEVLSEPGAVSCVGAAVSVGATVSVAADLEPEVSAAVEWAPGPDSDSAP